MSYVGDKDWLVEVQRGNISGASIVHKYGRNSNGAINTEEAVTSDGALYLASAASTVRVKAGGNAADTAAGAGAREVTIEGLDETGAAASEAVATAGASASSATTTTFVRVFRAYVSSQGTYITDGLSTSGANQGDIVIEDSGGSSDWITITQYEGQTQFAAYSVPLGKEAYLLGADVTVDSAKNSDVLFYARQDILDTSAPVKARRLKLYLDGIAGGYPFRPRSPLGSYPALTDLFWTFIPTANGTECSVDFELLLVDA